MDSASISVIEHWSSVYGVPAWIPLCIAYAETSITPTEIGDNGTSYGLFQLHTPGGQGDVWNQYGSSPSVLLSSTINAEIGIKPIASAYKSEAASNLTGFSLLVYVAGHSGHPDYTGVPAYYMARLQLAWSEAQSKGWLTLDSPSLSSSATSLAQPKCSAQTIEALGTYVGEGSAAGVQAGLFLFQKTANSVTINTIIDSNCKVKATYAHAPINTNVITKPGTSTTKTVQGPVQYITKTVSKVPAWAWWTLGVGAVAGISYYAYRRGWIHLTHKYGDWG